LGYQPNDLLKKSLHDFCILQDQQMLKDQLKLIYETKQTTPVQMTLHLMHANNSQNSNSTSASTPDASSIIKFKTNAYAFCNPCNDAFEFIVCTHQTQSRPPPPPPPANEHQTNANSNLLMNNNQQQQLMSLNNQQQQHANLSLQTSHLLDRQQSVSSAAINSFNANQQYHTLGQYNHSHLNQPAWNTSNTSPLSSVTAQSVADSSAAASTGSYGSAGSNYLIMSNKY
jgi:hypothetical protein